MKSTINRTRKIGIAIEVVVPIIGHSEDRDAQLLANVLIHQGIPAYARPYSHQPVPQGHLLCVEHDASLHDESR